MKFHVFRREGLVLIYCKLQNVACLRLLKRSRCMLAASLIAVITVESAVKVSFHNCMLTKLMDQGNEK